MMKRVSFSSPKKTQAVYKRNHQNPHTNSENIEKLKAVTELKDQVFNLASCIKPYFLCQISPALSNLPSV